MKACVNPRPYSFLAHSFPKAVAFILQYSKGGFSAEAMAGCEAWRGWKLSNASNTLIDDYCYITQRFLTFKNTSNFDLYVVGTLNCEYVTNTPHLCTSMTSFVTTSESVRKAETLACMAAAQPVESVESAAAVDLAAQTRPKYVSGVTHRSQSASTIFCCLIYLRHMTFPHTVWQEEQPS